MHLFHKHNHLLGGILLVAGTSIGVGMLALPVVTALGGFIPSLIIYLISWIFMVGIALLIVEACLWLPKDANLISISQKLLGTKGAVACWILYLFLFYCIMIAHMAIGGNAVSLAFSHSIPDWVSTLAYVIAFAPIVYLGTNAVDRINILLMVGVIITYILFLFVATPHIDMQNIARQNWSKIWPALPIILTAFGFQNLIPTLVNYMQRDFKKVKLAIWFGTSIPLVFYILWELMVLGVAPLEGENGLLEALRTGQSAVPALQAALPNSSLGLIAGFFSFFAMTTSFIGLAIAFFDFWADGLNWEKKGLKRIGIFLLVFGVPLVFVFVNPTIFFTALNLAGGLGMILLLGIMPILFVWFGRYIHKYPTNHAFVLGGRSTLIAMLGFCLIALAIMLYTL